MIRCWPCATTFHSASSSATCTAGAPTSPSCSSSCTCSGCSSQGPIAAPRSGNWIIGCVLGFLILASNFTGYLLPWDQLAYWAVTICTSMLDYVPLIGAPLQEMLRGGPEIGPRTLSIFFVLHIVFLPITMVVLLKFHFWLVRKSGGVVIPRAPGAATDRGPMVPVRPNLTVREATAALVLLAGLFVFALLVDAPLGDRETKVDGFINPGHVSAIIGVNGYKEVEKSFKVPQVIAGFEPLDILFSIVMILKQLKENRGEIENAYTRIVKHEGNVNALKLMNIVFDTVDASWRGIGTITKSGFSLKNEFEKHDASKKYVLESDVDYHMPSGCRCGDVLKAIIYPWECPLYNNTCTPQNPIGPCMVSQEGSCYISAKYGVEKI